LKDYHYEFIPKTYKGRRKPANVVIELMERDKQVIIRKQLNNTNLVTGQKLIVDSETVQQFVKRQAASEDRKSV